MSKGFLIFTYDKKGLVDLPDDKVKNYTDSAYLLALSILIRNPDAKISLVTDHILPKKYQNVFDKVVPIPWNDVKSTTLFAVEHRWKLFHATPYDETIVLDADMYAATDVTNLWGAFENHDVCYTSRVQTYRQEWINNDSYRKAFTNNHIPSVYSALHYFKKNEVAKEWYSWLEIIAKNWKDFYNTHIENNRPRIPSMDVTAGIAAKILDCENKVTTKNPAVSFVHMKSLIQGWEQPLELWMDCVGSYIDDNGNLKVGNFAQHGLFHYVEPGFVTQDRIELLEDIRRKMQ